MIDNKSVNILIVDDSIDNLKVVGSILLERGYNIFVSNDGESALKTLGLNKIDLVLMDIIMPGMDGFEVCIKMKSNPDTQHIPVIFLSAKIETEDVVRGFEVGGVDYVTKPFHKQELLARVDTHVRLKKTYDYLDEWRKEAVKSRDHYMSVLLNLGKVIFPDK
ncbi:MAG: response regulator [Bacteroidales bacterium]|nr:response regulator [Bacteroidales bacterium]